MYHNEPIGKKCGIQSIWDSTALKFNWLEIRTVSSSNGFRFNCFGVQLIWKPFGLMFSWFEVGIYLMSVSLTLKFNWFDIHLLWDLIGLKISFLHSIGLKISFLHSIDGLEASATASCGRYVIHCYPIYISFDSHQSHLPRPSTLSRFSILGSDGADCGGAKLCLVLGFPPKIMMFVSSLLHRTVHFLFHIFSHSHCNENHFWPVICGGKIEKRTGKVVVVRRTSAVAWSEWNWEGQCGTAMNFDLNFFQLLIFCEKFRKIWCLKVSNEDNVRFIPCQAAVEPPCCQVKGPCSVELGPNLAFSLWKIEKFRKFWKNGKTDLQL